MIKNVFFFSFFLFSSTFQAQDSTSSSNVSDFWDHVRFGGGVGFSMGNSFTNISVSPTMYYNFDDQTSIGVGLNTSYIKNSGKFTSFVYGLTGSVLYNPVESLQFSADVEQLRVNLDYNTNLGQRSDDFWNTALFLGVGYSVNNITGGIRYNLLFRDTDRLYTSAWMPFIRIVF
ncbi:hypothetical protein [Flavobacterium oreochromis]|uniref:Alpha-ketoglutarate decarboxylase n=2 Tax=Flavobacterium TaxID=237 RepID=A0A246GE60_9FLAO|nr:hypothetical protein [Flavobacterium oreochromis]OWP78985.1 hypothetical protein BWG23_00105 [Flavobacterium oreochromis]OWP79681.1 hypothetical protein BWK62_00120 [Flavobacterium oreochromis]POR30760.1 hypothetical protein BWK58_00210 [Flavobacterium columnare]QYS87125.1 hypothetical protein JJC03_03975 [Flavobacterium oreochromis]